MKTLATTLRRLRSLGALSSTLAAPLASMGLTGCAALAVLSAPIVARADDAAPAALPLVSPLFTDNMVLQRGRPVVVWGWTQPGQTVTVSISGKSAKGIGDAQGKWTAKLPALPVGGPYTMTVADQGKEGLVSQNRPRTARAMLPALPRGPYTTAEAMTRTISLSNILVGDVWVCSGQSNMEMGIGNVTNAAQEVASADYPQIRLFTVKKDIAQSPRQTLSGQWDICTPQTVRAGGWNGFSAVGYFFGRELYNNLKVPIGLIHTSWGGTPAEAWVSGEALQTMPDYSDVMTRMANAQAGANTASPKPNNPNAPTVLYNGMIAPLLPYGIKGAIWYQGESNAGRAYQYRTLLPTMIEDWRARWHEGNFPFYIVQLANFQQAATQPGDNDWAELREAQSLTASHLPNAGLAVTIDIGDAGDIHPKDKQDVGKRLALAALAQTYGEKIEYSGPQYKAMKVEGDKIRLTFTHTGGGLTAHAAGQPDTPSPLQGFAIAGEDHKFVWAEATINGSAIVVSSPTVPHPVAVRYAWAINPVCNLYNRAGLPASPFRTDEWPGITVKNR